MSPYLHSPYLHLPIFAPAWPLPLPPRSLTPVNLPADQAEYKLITEAIARNRPVGNEARVARRARALGLEQSLRPRGRPVGWRKAKKKG
jgi:hypothetical protein